MAYPSVTNTFANSTTASATQVNQNFTDLINGFSDGSKDFNMSNGTLGGNLIVNGNSTLGSASDDDITINGSLAASLAIKTNNTYDVGGSSIGLAGLYLGAPSSRTTRLRANQSLSGSNTLILPNGNGSSKKVLSTDGSGNLSWTWAPSFVSKNDDYAVLDTDGYNTIAVTVVNKTITLPTAADNTDREIVIIKDVSGNGTITIKGEAAGETVDGITGTTGITLDFYKESVTLKCTGSVWVVTNWTIPNPQYTLTASGTGWTTARAIGIVYKTRDTTPVWRIRFNLNSSNSTNQTTHNITISDITFKNTSSMYQSIACSQNNFSSGNRSPLISYCTPNSNIIVVILQDTGSFLGISGDVELESKPSIVI